MLKKYGLKIYLHSNLSQDYTISSLSIPNACYDLFQSTILFDRYGKYYKITKTIKNQKGMISYYSNLAQIDPSIMDKFNYALEELNMLAENEAVKEFTKTKLFKYITDME